MRFNLNRSLFIITILVLQSVLFSACNNAPRNRPTINLTNQNVEIDQEQIDELEAKAEEERLAALARPSNAVKIESGFCACQNAKAITLGNCSSFCAGKPSADPILYFNVQPTEAITERDDIKTFHNWCTKEIVDPVTSEPIASNPNCVIEAKDADNNAGQVAIQKMSAGSNAVEVNIAQLDEDKTYRIRIVETGSGAYSSTVQIRKFSTPVTDPVGGPLRTVPIQQYTCMNITIAEDGSNLFYEDASRIHFYFNDENRPEPLSSIFANIHCHDIYKYGTTPINNPLLEETPGAYTLWDIWDPRFWDTDGDGEAQINQLLQQNVQDQGFSMPEPPKLFFKFKWYNGPDVGSANSGDSGGASAEPVLAELGYYMTPWIDQTTFKAFCPKQTNYFDTSNQLFVAMRDLVGVDTEGLYIAKQEGSSDFLLIRESVLKSAWFYLENGQHIEPNNDTVTGKQIQFYYPVDATSPFIKKSHQSVYTVKKASEVGGDNVSQDQQSGTGTSSNYPPHDKRIGCVPSL
jgi:hypothetical protein